MKYFRHYLMIPALLSVLAVLGCDGVGPTGPLADLDDARLTAASEKGGKGKGKWSTTSGTSETSRTSDTESVITTGDATLLREDVSIVSRIEPLPHAVMGTAVIGPMGGTISLPEAGVYLDVKADALREATEITLTAPAGDKLAVDLQPHGLQFNKAVAIRFEKRVIANDGSLLGVYFSGTPTDPTFLEFFKLVDNESFLLLLTNHFSGYALASL